MRLKELLFIGVTAFQVSGFGIITAHSEFLVSLKSDDIEILNNTHARENSDLFVATEGILDSENSGFKDRYVADKKSTTCNLYVINHKEHVIGRWPCSTLGGSFPVSLLETYYEVWKTPRIIKLPLNYTR